MKLAIKNFEGINGFNQKALEILAFSLFFAAGTYSSKAIVIGLGMSNLQTLASFFIYLYWSFMLLKLILNNLFVLNRIIKFELIYLIILFFNYIIFSNAREFYRESAMFIRQIIIVYIPSGAICGLITEFKDCYKYMKKTAIYGTFFMLFSYLCGYSEIWGYQYLGIQICPFALILFGSFLETNKTLELFLFFINCVLIFMGGRQSLVVLLLGIWLIYYFTKVDNKSKRTIFLVSTLFMVVVCVLMSSVLIELLNFIMRFFNINSRTLDMLVNGEFSSTATRSYIYESSIDIIKTNGNKISGLFSDRFYLRNYDQFTRWIAYPHNIILEILLDFGIGGGSILIIILFYYLLSAFINANKYKKIILIILISLSMIRLMVSSSFMIEGVFYTMLGMIFSKSTNERCFKKS